MRDDANARSRLRNRGDGVNHVGDDLLAPPRAVFHFGPPQRRLFGMHHPAPEPGNDVLIMCAPLLQDGIRCHRALWVLAEALAAAGTDVIRYDWFGSGDSAGAADDIDVPGLVADVALAEALARRVAPHRRRRFLALRSAALPLLGHASDCAVPVDLVLWAPQLDGAAMVATWRRQHAFQLHGAGRYLRRVAASGGDLLGFAIAPRLLPQCDALHARHMRLAAGSRLLLVDWQGAPRCDGFLEEQARSGVDVGYLELDAGDAPAWDAIDAFETQVFPRRAVARLAIELAGMR